MANRSQEFDRLTRIWAQRYGLPASVLKAQQQTESNFNPSAVSSAGAFGLTQFMPGTARSYNVQRGTSHSAVSSQIKGQAAYLKALGGRKNLAGALASYAGGPGNPQSSYARLVLSRAGQYKGLDRGAAPSARPSGSRSVTTRTPGVDNSALRQQLAYQYFSNRSSPNALLSLAQGLQGAQDVPGKTVTKTTATSAPVREGRGNVSVAPGADRPGAKLSSEVVNFVRRVSGAANRPITITTGTNHNRLTVNGNVSDHWDGHAADIAVPVDSRQGDMIAGRALTLLGVPRARARQMAQHGGLFNVNYRGHRYQVIWKTYEGGNHHNHVHIGIR